MCAYMCGWQQKSEVTDPLELLHVRAEPSLSRLQEPCAHWTAGPSPEPQWSEDSFQDGLTVTLTPEALGSGSVPGLIAGLWNESCRLAFCFEPNVLWAL